MVCTQKNRLIKTVLLSTQKHMFKFMGKAINVILCSTGPMLNKYVQDVCSSGPMCIIYAFVREDNRRQCEIKVD